jgi:hypothetical protein
VLDAVLPLGYPSSQIHALVASFLAESTAGLAGIPTAVIEAATSAMRWGWSDEDKIVWLSTIPFGVIAFAGAIFVRDPSPYLTKHVSVTLEKERLDLKKNDRLTIDDFEHTEHGTGKK